MKKIALTVFMVILLFDVSVGQVSNVNIAGSYDGVFTLNTSQSEMKIAGSPYLTENWLFGTLELKKALYSSDAEESKTDEQIRQYTERIKKCDDLIQQISDPGYKTIGLTLSRAKGDRKGKDLDADIDINKSEFKELAGIIDGFQGDLLSFLNQLKAEYQASLEEINRIDGLFRYNLYAQEFEMVYDRDTFAITAPLDVKSISLSNKKFIYGFYIDREFGNDYLGSSYFEVLNEGKCKLLIRHEVKIKDHSGPVTYNWAGGGESFQKIRQLYFQSSDDMEVIQMKKNKKFLKRIFADKYYEVERYIKSENINVKDEKELIRIFNYYNDLKS